LPEKGIVSLRKKKRRRGEFFEVKRFMLGETKMAQITKGIRRNRQL